MRNRRYRIVPCDGCLEIVSAFEEKIPKISTPNRVIAASNAIFFNLPTPTAVYSERIGKETLIRDSKSGTPRRVKNDTTGEIGR